MTIQNDVRELNQLNAEIKRLSAEARTLRKRAKEAEARIADYLKAKDQPGLKYEGQAIVLEQVTKRPARKKVEYEERAIDVMESHGVKDPERLWKELSESRRGSPQEVSKLKVRKVKQRK